MLGIAIRAWHSDTCVLNQTVGAMTDQSWGSGWYGGVCGGGEVAYIFQLVQNGGGEKIKKNQLLDYEISKGNIGAGRQQRCRCDEFFLQSTRLAWIEIHLKSMATGHGKKK